MLHIAIAVLLSFNPNRKNNVMVVNFMCCVDVIRYLIFDIFDI